jgi:hypothetical protein
MVGPMMEWSIASSTTVVLSRLAQENIHRFKIVVRCGFQLFCISEELIDRYWLDVTQKSQ